MQDQWMEVIPLPYDSPSKAMAEFARIVNEVYSKSEAHYSKRWDTMMEVDLRHAYVETMANEYFAVIFFELVRRKTREEFLRELGED